MRVWQRMMIRRAIAEQELWIARTRALISPDADCSSIEESIARAEREVARVRALL
jgi:hypothetical protein